MSFRKFIESRDIFGFREEKPKDAPPDSLSTNPIKQFNVELMLDYLSNKKIGAFVPHTSYTNEMYWGSQPGAIKLEVDTGYTFFIKKLGTDRQGNPRWITKRAFQLNRNGYGGMEDMVAQEVYEQIAKYAETGIEAPLEEYKELGSLVDHIYSKLKRTSKEIFIPEGVKKLNDNAFIINFGVRGHGLEARSQQRVEQNQTLVAYDEEQGTIRVTNYNLQSRTGRGHEFKINQNDLDLYFFPSQDREEISETIAIHMKYY